MISKRFSVLVLAYRSAALLFDAIDSILDQDYADIELIVSDDASGDFDTEAVGRYVQERRRSNLTRLCINVNESNLGTVRNCNRALSMSTGEYVKFLAADDALFDPAVVRAFVEAFKQTDAPVVASQCLVYDETLTRPLRNALSDDRVAALKTLSPLERYRALLHRDLVCAVGTAFRREFFDRFAVFDEAYFIDEDRPTWLRISRLGCPIHFMDKVTAKYRTGGISGHCERYDDRTQTAYLHDLIRVWQREVLPFPELLGEGVWAKAAADYIRQYEWPATMGQPAPVRLF